MARATSPVGALLRPVRGTLVVAGIVQGIAALFGVVPFVAVAELGRLLLGPAPDRGRVVTLVVVAAAALLVRLVLLVVASAVSHVADNDFQLVTRTAIVERLGRLPLGWFGETSSGRVKKLVQDDVEQMHHLVAHSLLEIISALVVPVASLAYLFWVNPAMAAVTLVPVVAGLVVYRLSGQAYLRTMQSMDSATAEINSTAVEFVRAIPVIRTFGQAGRAYRRFTEASDRFSRFFLQWVGTLIGPRAGSEVILSPVAMLLVIAVVGSLFVGGGLLSVAELFPFLILGVGLSAPISALTFAEHQLQAATGAAHRIAELLDTPVAPEPRRVGVPEHDGAEFAGVHFSYDGEHEVLRGLDLALRPGTVTALVGESGAGKSTVAALLPRFWDVTGGSVTLGGVDVRDIPGVELHRRISFVFQDVALLSESVRENIRMARPDAEAADVERVARLARIHDRILELPRGYDSVVGQDARFSGGEAQRVAIARALLVDAPILVLDEATAYADPESETAIQRGLAELVRGRTVLVIAHRLRTVRDADRIAVLADGRIAEQGTHDELLARGGRYARLWALGESSRHPGPGGPPGGPPRQDHPRADLSGARR